MFLLFGFYITASLSGRLLRQLYTRSLYCFFSSRHLRSRFFAFVSGRFFYVTASDSGRFFHWFLTFWGSFGYPRPGVLRKDGIYYCIRRFLPQKRKFTLVFPLPFQYCRIPLPFTRGAVRLSNPGYGPIITD